MSKGNTRQMSKVNTRQMSKVTKERSLKDKNGLSISQISLLKTYKL